MDWETLTSSGKSVVTSRDISKSLSSTWGSEGHDAEMFYSFGLKNTEKK